MLLPNMDSSASRSVLPQPESSSASTGRTPPEIFSPVSRFAAFFSTKSFGIWLWASTRIITSVVKCTSASFHPQLWMRPGFSTIWISIKSPDCSAAKCSIISLVLSEEQLSTRTISICEWGYVCRVISCRRPGRLFSSLYATTQSDTFIIFLHFPIVA